MIFLRRMCRRRLRWVTALIAGLFLLILMYNYRQYSRGKETHSSPICVFPNDDPICKLLNKRNSFTEIVATTKRPHLDAGAQWCPDDTIDKPVFPGGIEPQRWQEVRGRNVTVFSAFLDHRQALGGPLIRIIANGLQGQFNSVGNLFCTLWYTDLDLQVTVGPAIYDRIYPSLLYPEMWVAHFILCPMPVIGDIGVPFAVSVTARSCESPSNALMLLNRLPEPAGQYSFAACFPPVYGKIGDWKLFIEWIELYKILGMKTAFFYNHSMDADVTRVMNRYQEKFSDHIIVIPWQLPKKKLVNYFSQHDAINDCLYRAGRSHKYVAIMDLDEVMTPRKHSNWTEMMRFLSRPNVGAYLFQHAYFRRNSTGEKPYLITQQSLWRTDVVTPPGKIRCKSMYVAANAIKADIHYPYALLEQSFEHIVPPEMAMLHHYRPEPMETFRRNPEKFNFIEDKYMTKYKKELKRRVVKRLGDLHRTRKNTTTLRPTRPQV